MALVRLDELTYPQVRRLLDEGTDTLLWPVGTLEAHGRHSPIGTDSFCAEGIACRLGERTGWPVAPTLGYGVTTGLVAYPGGVRIDKELYGRLVRTILENFLRIGFRRVVIINGHGGNTETISAVMKEMITEDRGNRHLILIDWWQLDGPALEAVYGRKGGHAALDETACVLAFRPELVDPDALEPSEVTTITPGVVAAPYSAAVILYEEGDSTPDFDPDKAGRFVTMVTDRIEAILADEVEQFERSFGKKG